MTPPGCLWAKLRGLRLGCGPGPPSQAPASHRAHAPSEGACPPYTCSGGHPPPFPQAGPRWALQSPWTSLLSPGGLRCLPTCQRRPSGPRWQTSEWPLALGTSAPLRGRDLGAKGHPAHAAPPVAWKLPYRLPAMFSLHCREGVTGWRCLHSSPFNSRCVSCTRVLSAWRGWRVPPWAFLWMLRVQSREHGVESLWPRERWGDKVCPSQPICISPTGSQGARLPHLITQGTAFRHQCDSGTFEVPDTGNPACQWPSGPRGCEHRQPWVLWASTTGSEGQRKPLPAEASGRECAPGGEATASDGRLASCWAQTLTPDAVCVDGGRRAVCQCSPSRR